ncbi:MAG: 3-keto-disaccharide hydrolase [Verrucomicrobiales bacterium]
MFKLNLKKSLAIAVAILAPMVSQAADEAVPAKNGWTNLFDGKTLSNWTQPTKGDWAIVDGMVVGKGRMSHIFSPNTYTNVEFKADIKLNNKGNSGMYFRAAHGTGWPKGYEAQVENTSPDPQKTGSLYNFSKIGEQLIEDDTWWNQHIIAIGNRIIIKVNGKVVTDFVDEKNTFKSGHLALQQHDPGSVVHYKNLMVRALPSDEQKAIEIASKETPELKKAPATSK